MVAYCCGGMVYVCVCVCVVIDLFGTATDSRVWFSGQAVPTQ